MREQGAPGTRNTEEQPPLPPCSSGRGSGGGGAEANAANGRPPRPEAGSAGEAAGGWKGCWHIFMALNACLSLPAPAAAAVARTLQPRCAAAGGCPYEVRSQKAHRPGLCQ